MAEIVVLNKWRTEKTRRPQVRIGEINDAGQIVLFTGVRYERFDDRSFDDRGDRKAENHAARAE